MTLSIPSFTLPSVVSSIASRLPQWPHSLGLSLALNAAVRLHVLPTDELKALEGKRFIIVVEDAGSVASVTVRNGWFFPERPSKTADLRFSAKLSAYLQLLNRQEDPDTLFFQRALVIEGDTELGLRVKNMLDAVDWAEISAKLPFSLIQRIHTASTFQG